ncbi:hypothetical protein AOLI_G00186140 [Acnodon oligacanthus]
MSLTENGVEENMAMRVSSSATCPDHCCGHRGASRDAERRRAQWTDTRCCCWTILILEPSDLSFGVLWDRRGQRSLQALGWTCSPQRESKQSCTESSRSHWLQHVITDDRTAAASSPGPSGIPERPQTVGRQTEHGASQRSGGASALLSVMSERARSGSARTKHPPGAGEGAVISPGGETDSIIVGFYQGCELQGKWPRVSAAECL